MKNIKKVRDLSSYNKRLQAPIERGNDIILKIVHFSEDVANDAAFVVLGDLRYAGPRDSVVEVIAELVVLRQAMQVRGLHCDEVINLWGGVRVSKDGEEERGGRGTSEDVLDGAH